MAERRVTFFFASGEAQPIKDDRRWFPITNQQRHLGGYDINGKPFYIETPTVGSK